MTITKEADGTTSYSGFSFDALNYFAEALKIKYIIF